MAVNWMSSTGRMGGNHLRPETYVGRGVADVTHDPALRGALSDLEDIEGRTYFGARGLGVSFVAADGRITTVHVHVQPDGEHGAYRADLPWGLRQDMRRVDVRSVLGIPERSGEQTNVPVLGVGAPWDRFSTHGLLLHVRYRLDDVPGIAKLAFMLPEVAPSGPGHAPAAKRITSGWRLGRRSG